MKKLFVLLTSILLFSCSISNDNEEAYHEILPINKATLPIQFHVNQAHEIKVLYKRPTNCHAFEDIYYSKEANKRTVAIVAQVFNNNSNCDVINQELETSFLFKPEKTGAYVFKFWLGTNDNGEDEYETHNITVEN